MKFKIKETYPVGYSSEAYHFVCPMCEFLVLKNMDIDFVKMLAHNHLSEEHSVSTSFIEFKVGGKKMKTPKVLPETIVIVDYIGVNGNRIKSVVEPGSGQDPLTFATWASKQYPNSKYVAHTYIPVRTEEIK